MHWPLGGTDMRICFSLATMALLVSGIVPVFAQTSGNSASTPSASTAGTLEEIVVTAQKRSERLQDVPIYVSAVSGADIATRRLASTEDLKYVVPALNWGQEAGFSAPFLRGIGTDVFVPNADTDVATYIDGVFIADDTASISRLMYVDRVEILEGPQGTLYGRNAVAGAINVVTLTPGPEFQGDAKVGFGNYALKELSGYVSGPLTEDFYAGLYVAGSIRNHYESYTVPYADFVFPGQPIHEASSDVRLKAVWKIGDLTLTGTAEHVETQSADQNSFRNVYPNALGYQFGAPKIIQNYIDTDDFPGFSNVITNLVALREEARFDWGTILGISGFHDNLTRIGSDVDGTSANLVGQAAYPQTGKQYSQELQVLSPDVSKIKWIGGIYLFQEDGTYVNDYVVCPIICPVPYTNNTGNVRTKSAAAFGQGTFPIVEGLNLTVGGRYTYDHKAYQGAQLNQGAMSGDIISVYVAPDQATSWKQFNPKVSLDYKLDNTLLYVTYATGFKSGVYNQAAPTDPGPVNPEKLTDIEVGSKSEFIGGRLRFNTSIYHYNFKDIQVQVNNGGTSGSQGAEAILQNAASAQAYGIELSSEALLTNALKLDGSVAWEHSRYTSFYGAVSYLPAPVGNTEIFVNATGNPLQRAPEWTASLGGQYRVGLPGSFTGLIHLHGYYNGGFNWEPTGALKEPEYKTLGGDVQLLSPDGLWTGTVWATNITNEYYHEIALITGFGTLVGDAPPRMFGINLERKF
jgi:iron complex outermembrane receptor protein